MNRPLPSPPLLTRTSRARPANPIPPREPRGPRSADALLARWDALAQDSDHLLRKPLGEDSEGRPALPRYLFLGPRGGGDFLRLGLFATLHGDEPEGILALTRLVERLARQPDLARGYAIFLYPLCNPTGFADGTRHARSGRDLNREFWSESPEPEVRLIETELWTHAFHGIVSLHSDDTSDGVYGYVNGEVLSQHLLEPALIAAEQHLPRNRHRRIDGFPARRGIVQDTFEGVLRAVPGLRPAPFEITFETPQLAPLHRQVDATVAALETILVEYQYLMAIGQGI
ncbi:MAG: M14 family metallocarboxypeptidase [Verrucomicrobiales bacterium]|nr:M14 family metallocarboxypeptidase [Verrucomicrobiales bacterium]